MLLHHICLAKVRVSLQHAIPYRSPGYPFCEYLHLLVCRRGRVVYYLVEFKTMTKHKQTFVHKPD